MCFGRRGCVCGRKWFKGNKSRLMQYSSGWPLYCTQCTRIEIALDTGASIQRSSSFHLIEQGAFCLLPFSTSCLHLCPKVWHTWSNTVYDARSCYHMVTHSLPLPCTKSLCSYTYMDFSRSKLAVLGPPKDLGVII